jgi:RNA polymerase sigma-70 factor (ECF subfamily)
MNATRTPNPPPPPPGSPEERALLERFVTAFTELDVDALIALMTDDIWVRMPPLPFEYRGRADVRRFFTVIRTLLGRVDRVVPVRANGQPAWGEYERDQITGGLHLAGVIVVGLAGDKICELTRF